MAFSEGPIIVSRISETTLTTADLYKLAYLSSDGYVWVGDYAGTTGPRQAPFGVCYGVTKTTSTQSEAIPIAIGGIVKVKMTSDSTQVPGEFLCGSSDGLGVKASTSLYIIGRIVDVTTGGTQNIASVLWAQTPWTGGVLGLISSTANT